ncbi:MAG: fumarylacetoacetate hydrolase family protein [Betaproteobacteria bacterium]|nr:fumarylacetoacetate hydrolase family protein [Betaproteobacteria bacterium]
MKTLNDLLNLDALPSDWREAALVGRAWLPGEPAGPSPIAVRPNGDVVDLAAVEPTMSQLLARPDRVALARSAPGKVIATVATLLANSGDGRNAGRASLLAPIDLQAIKASGVTFVQSLLERVIEEQARGDTGKAEAIRAQVTRIIGDNLAAVKPGSREADEIKRVLVAQGAWSQYLEVGIGPDAVIFTKAQVMSAVGLGAEVGLHPKSSWNNPEPEIVLAVTAAGETVGATLGNDVNLRDFEGRSALLLGKSKDNNASCAIGPFIRLFDESFGIDDVRQAELALEISGTDGFVLDGVSPMNKISRDPLDIVNHAWGSFHQYPDGFMLFLGTMFAPIKDRGAPGMGFTHKVGDLVSISTPKLGRLANRVTTSDQAAPWTFGISALMKNLAARGLLR